MTLWLAEKHHAKMSELLEFEIQLITNQIKLESGPLPWAEFTEVRIYRNLSIHIMKTDQIQCYFIALHIILLEKIKIQN